MLSLQEALKINFNLPLLDLKTEEKSIFDAYSFILAQDIYITRPLPAFDNSAMDGYAINLSFNGDRKVENTILAGVDSSNIILQDNQAIRIMTGAMIPQNANAVVPFEDAELKNGVLKIYKEFSDGANIRKKGEEKAQGDLALNKGRQLEFGDIGLLASQGLDRVLVYQKPSIGVFSSGNEVKEVGTQALEHQIYNINAPSIIATLNAYQHHCNYLGILKDDLTLEKEILKASEKYDVIITSGGVSMGNADLLEEILLKNQAQIFYHKINLKPGKPIMIAKLNQCYFFCLPGNPLSAISNLLAFVIPILQRLSNASDFYPSFIKAKSSTPLYFKNKRSHIILGQYQQGIFTPYKEGKYSPSAISTFCNCEAFAIFDESISEIKKDQELHIITYKTNFTHSMGFINQ
ncbi:MULTISPECIES: molybdopterin molybdotransferase MoeA [unclassified Helicobacter]|uniref:molybdopterin molybdotransferase MoeA n=1 Tax=unclassified Helicobacter TaxID=2593540 RepID=UPI000CF09708|nr:MULTISPECIES: molybdopterin molybdotransferase MoeA [unclassified Helicobacter]